MLYYGIIFQVHKKIKKRLLYISLWGVFCITFSLYSIVNVIYMNSQDTHSFISETENVASSAYRSPPYIFQIRQWRDCTNSL